MRKINAGIFKIVAAGLCLALCLFMFSGRADSDFGNFSGNSDYGGSHSGGGHSGGYSGGGGWSGGHSYGDSDGLSSLLGVAALSGGGDDWILIAIVVVVVLFVAMSKNKNSQRRQQLAGTGVGLPSSAAAGLRPISDYVRLDPRFDEAKFTTHLSNLYVQMQDAWRGKDIETLRPYMTDAFYGQMDRQLDALRKARQTDYTERIAVLGVNLLGFRQANGLDYITARVKTRIVTYILDDLTGKLVSGDKNREKFMEYEWDLVRKSGTKTEPGKDLQSVNCPSCGAPLTIGAAGRCAYCGSVVSSLDTNWAVSAIRGISQRTA